MYTAHPSRQAFNHSDQDIVENCAFEIGIHDLELDPQLLEYFRDCEPNLCLYVKWSFLGLEQRTDVLPVTKAYFDLKVTYCGPPSLDVCNHVKQTTVRLELMLLDANGGTSRFGEGTLELLPALQQPEKRFFRCVPVNISMDGKAFVYCSFKQHNNCCAAPCCPNGFNCLGCSHQHCPRRLPPAKDILEIGIGRLKLDDMDFPTRSRPPHIYVEYSILGYCGSHLETESEPKNELLQFKHKKRLKVTKDNAVHLERMLQRRDPEPLTFIVLTEPCELSRDTDIEEIGSASVSLHHDMLESGHDLESVQVPVVDKQGERKGTLSVTVLGIDTLRRHAE